MTETKLSAACCVVRAIKLFGSRDTLKMTYFFYFHSIMNYGLIFWGNTWHSNSIFKLQKRIIRIIMGMRNRDSCTEVFKVLNILPLQSKYIIPLVLFVVKNKNQFKINSEIGSISTRCNSNLFQLSPSLTAFQKGPCYMGIKVYNRLPPQIKDLSHIKQFWSSLKGFHHHHLFYTLEEF